MKQTIYLMTVISVLAFGCVTTQSVSWPAGTSKGSLVLPEGAKKIAALNRINIGYPPPKNPEAVIKYPNQLEAMNGLLTGFYNEIYNRKFLTYVGTKNDFKHVADGTFPDSLNLSQIQSVINDADILVSLDMMDQSYEDTYTVDIRKEKLGNNLFKETDYIIGRRTVHIKAGWRVYNAKTGEILHEQVQEEDYWYEAESLERQLATELLEKNLTKELRNWGIRKGAEYAAFVSPTKHFTYRTIYDSGSPEMEKAASMVKDNQWDEASEVWSKLVAKESNNKAKAKLYHNLAIYEERAGNIEKAKEYAQLAANHHKLGIQTQRTVGY